MRGLRGNWKIVSTNVASGTLRSGILLHTGEWPGWAPPMPMPNSLGCIHSYPESIRRVWELLVSLGVDVRPNNNGALPCKYTAAATRPTRANADYIFTDLPAAQTPTVRRGC